MGILDWQSGSGRGGTDVTPCQSVRRLPRGRTQVVIGLTGPIAAGKSTVAAMLESLGGEAIDADRVYHSLIRPHSPLWTAVVARFGEAVVGPDQRLDRGALARIVFADPAALRDLEQLTHPAVVAEIQRRIARSPAPLVVVEAVKLVPSGLNRDVDAVWLITADEETRLQRLMARGGLDRDEARARIAASANTVPTDVPPDVTIDTSGSLAETRRAVVDALDAMVESAA